MEELVMRLRDSADWADHFAVLMGRDGNAHAPIMREAADAIEELGARLEAHNEWFAKADKKIEEYKAAYIAEHDARIAEVGKTSCWIPVEERLPDEFVSVQAHMTDAGPFPSVREAYLAGGKWFFPALTEYHPIDKWAYFQEPPKEET